MDSQEVKQILNFVPKDKITVTVDHNRKERSTPKQPRIINK